MKRLFIRLIRLYQKHVSPARPRACRFTPTCSEYAVQAFEEYGAFVGFFLAAYRVLRCNPLCRGGYDPVPQKRNKGKPEK